MCVVVIFLAGDFWYPPNASSSSFEIPAGAQWYKRYTPSASFSSFKIHAGMLVVRFGVDVVNARHHFPVLKITRDWCIKN